MEIDGSDKEEALSLRRDSVRVHSSPSCKKKLVGLSDVIELTDSEPDVEIVAASNVSTNAKRRGKGAGETKEEVVVNLKTMSFQRARGGNNGSLTMLVSLVYV